MPISFKSVEKVPLASLKIKNAALRITRTARFAF
jgi:hypothetical protein